MALDINGYNATFDAFVEFAKTQEAAGKERAVARFDADAAKELGGIVNRTIKPASSDWVGIGVGRLASLKRANNITRDAFMKAVSDMFGGKSHIPASVKDAMKLEDYGKGKPLTARRILAVAEAITKLDDAVLSRGFSKDEVAKMHKVADLCAGATGCSKVAAFIEVSTPGSKANRLMNYGGRFLESAESFKNGLELIDTFKSWFSGVGTELGKLGVNGRRTEEMDLTMLNASVSSFDSDKLQGTEKFVFESIAHDPSFNLAERDKDRLFGMENNAATHFFGLGLNGSCTQTIAQIPPEKRNTLFSAITLFYTLADNPINANETPDMHDSLTSSDSPLMVSRILRNFDKVAEMEANGTLTLENLVKLCFPELPEGAECSVDEVRKLIADMTDKIVAAMNSGRISMESFVQAARALSETGCSVEEAIGSCTGGPQPQPPKYVSTGTLSLSAYDGTTKEGRQQLKTDLGRPGDYYYDWNRDKGLLPNDKGGFTFNFPGETPVVTGASDEGKANIAVVCDKVESLCGKAHPAQASSVMTMLSQSGLSILRGGLAQYNLISSEHSACDFTLSKDEKTGDVTIRYSSPKGLPFEFEWTATVRSDGFVTTTPFRFADMRSSERAFLSGDGAKRALAAGYRSSELPRLAKTFALFKLAMNATDEAALAAVLDPASKASRLASYGGRFTESAESFRAGLDLMDRFAEWYVQLGSDIAQNKFDTPTKVNVTEGYVLPESLKGYETFVFQDLAIRPDLNLNERDAEKLFGIKHNDAMNFFARGNGHACTGTLLKLSPEKRQVVYAAFRAIEPPLDKNPGHALTNVGNNTGYLARILRHFDEVKGLMSAGKLDRVSLNKILTPDLPSNATSQQVNDAILARMSEQCADAPVRRAASNLMDKTGCTFTEAMEAINTGKKLAELDDIAPSQIELNKLDGTTQGGREKMLGDLNRPRNVNYTKTKEPVIADENCHFTVKIGGETIRCDKGEDANSNAHVADKIENMCGKVHVAQATNVMLGLAQGAHTKLLPVLAQHGISSGTGAEHMPLVYTLSKNENTGAVTIHYSEPEGFPFKFHWETTVNLDGHSTSTPIEVEDALV